MTAPPPIATAPVVPAPQDSVLAALTTAQDQLAALAAEPAYRDDPLQPYIKAFHASIAGLQSLYAGLRATTDELIGRAESDQRAFMTWAVKQREQFTADLATDRAAELNRIQADKLRHEARIKAGLIDAATDALRDLIIKDRRLTRIQSFALIAVPVLVLISTGVAIGWCMRGTDAVLAVGADLHATAEMANTLKHDAEAMRLVATKLGNGMTPADLSNFFAISRVVATDVNPWKDDVVPWPCIAAVPDGTFKTAAGKPIHACAIAIKDNVPLQGGQFLTQALAARTTVTQ